MNELPVISIVIPVFKEEGNLISLSEHLNLSLDKTGSSYEIIFSDDSSTGNSFSLIRELHQKDSRIKGYALSRNFSHPVALLAGIFTETRNRPLYFIKDETPD